MAAPVGSLIKPNTTAVSDWARTGATLTTVNHRHIANVFIEIFLRVGLNIDGFSYNLYLADSTNKSFVKPSGTRLQYCIYYGLTKETALDEERRVEQYLPN